MGKFFGVFGLLVLFATGNAVANEIPENETREQMIERVMKLPPEPSAIKNNLTILGVDVNNNNIRDNVERQIAFDLFDNKPLMRQTMREAQLWAEVFHADGVKDLLVEIEWEQLLLGCDTLHVKTREELYNVTDNRYNVYKLLEDTWLRRRAYRKASYFKRDGFLKMPSKDERVKYCAQFK